MKYSITIEQLQGMYPKMKVFSFMFYVQPGIRDMEILELGIRGMLNAMPEYGKPNYPLHILAEEINEEAARAYNVNRGWLIRFVFPYINEEESLITISNQSWEEFISGGLDELRIEHKYLFVEDLLGKERREHNV